MARYIDADKLVEMYERSAEDDWNKKTAPTSWAEAFECAIADIDDQPTADVVPKSEVAREIMKEVRQALLNMVLANAMGESYDIEKCFDEIEKKFTEEKK